MSTTAETLADLWRELLRVPGVGPDDDFFDLGGDSFQAVQLASLVSRRFGVEADPDMAFARPCLAEQAAWIGALSRAALPAEAVAGAALSTQQEDFLVWMAEPGEPRRDIGAIAIATRIRDAFDTTLFARALGEVVKRHEALRTVCRRDGDGYRTQTLADLPPEVAEARAKGATPEERLADALALAERERTRLSDVTADPMVRALVIRIDPDDQVLVLSVHHFVTDGWSMGIVLREAAIVYSALRAGLPSPLRPLDLAYGSYCAWTRTRWEANRSYWETVLDGAPRALVPFPERLPTDRFSWRAHPFTVAAATAGRLRDAAKARRATPFMAVTTCWTSVLAAWTGVDDLVVMSPAPGRTEPAHNDLVGCLVQSLVLRIDASGSPARADLLARVRATVLGATSHQLHAYQDVRPKVPYPSRIHYESWGQEPNFPGLRSEPFPLPRLQENLVWHAPPGEHDLSSPWLVVEEQRDGSLRAAVVYNHFGFAQETAARFAELFAAEVNAFLGELA
ncbi:condensation domain-containing protein [Actinocorallia sp. A-T 12471]|uniref:condensation domain-containing protein n=1 Tax=Actinocorallia sp. A-T 12471 TaxID=3089813 RepID=UPI0029D1C03F|nr:condensation domain-containing protein [Actinocorallia sp. A-T 12471]MDX6739392.1 condensation domain-containing protein [Actinocorallia sp. A-T 12471]